jgi:predicted DCC family thiol-disulfide oxidoreductase YuxK
MEVFYDGSCAVCMAAMQLYRKRLPENRLRFIDVAHPGFDASLYGRNQEEFMAKIHVRDSHGKFHTDMEGLMTIWRAFPKCSLHRVVGRLVSLPWVNQVARAGYMLFARNRHLFSKHKDACADESCRR